MFSASVCDSFCGFAIFRAREATAENNWSMNKWPMTSSLVVEEVMIDSMMVNAAVVTGDVG